LPSWTTDLIWFNWLREKLDRNKEEKEELSLLHVAAYTVKRLKTTSIVNINRLRPDFTWEQQTRSVKFKTVEEERPDDGLYQAETSHLEKFLL
jgi:hypothetical protein